jgi:hypothetical protein
MAKAGILRIVSSTRRRPDPSDEVMPKKIALATVLLLALAGCQSPPPVAEPAAQRLEEPEPAPPAPVEPPPTPIAIPTASERALAAGIALYDAGKFNGAIKRLLGAREIWNDSTTPGATANRLAAHKYLAFSYCVTNRRTQCRQQFVDAIKLEPNFDLTPAEKTHPLWGPEFDRARKQASAPAAPAARPAQPAATPSRRSQ